MVVVVVVVVVVGVGVGVGWGVRAGILRPGGGGGQGPRKIKSVGIFKLTCKQTSVRGLTPLRPPGSATALYMKQPRFACSAIYRNKLGLIRLH